MQNSSNIYTMSHYRQSDFNDSQIDADKINHNFQIERFKQKYIFKPFQYQQKLEQTLVHQLKSLNSAPTPNPTAQRQLNRQNKYCSFEQEPAEQVNKNSNVRFGSHAFLHSFNSTSKSINTNRTIWGGNLVDVQHKAKNNSSPSKTVNQAYQNTVKPMISRPPNLLMSRKQSSNFKGQKSQILGNESVCLYGSFTNGQQKQNRSTVSNGRGMKKKTFFNQQTSQQTRNLQNYKSAKKLNQIKQQMYSSNPSYLTSAIVLQGQTLCQSIASKSGMIQNFMKNKYQNGIINTQMLNNTIQATKKAYSIPHPLSFYSFCMLLFPQTPKSIPCPVFIIDTLFYTTSNQSKDIIYLFKDRKRNILVKMKNKNKSVYELFMKRRQNYETSKMKQDKLKKAGYNLDKNNGRYVLQSQSRKTLKTINNNQKAVRQQTAKNSRTGDKAFCNPQTRFNLSVKCFQGQNSYQQNSAMRTKDNCIIQEQQSYQQIQTGQNESSAWDQQVAEYGHPGSQDQIVQLGQQSQQLSRVSLEGSIVQLCHKLGKLSFHQTHKLFMTENKFAQTEGYRTNQNGFSDSIGQSPIITPSNSIRQSFHSLQTNYLALLKYNNGQMIRLKTQQLKAIFHNPLYANQRFKNNNNTQYIQALPIQEESRDIKVYSLHFHYQLFKDEQLFSYTMENLYKENQYSSLSSQFTKNNTSTSSYPESMLYQQQKGGNRNVNTFNHLSLYKRNNILLKKKLKQMNIEVYLYYLIFQMYTYISMHYNKQILNGIFRFIQYDNDYALFETQNLIVKQMPKEAQFIKAKIFNQQFIQDNKFSIPQLKGLKRQISLKIDPMQNKDESSISAPNQTAYRINKQIMKISLSIKQSQTQFQKQVWTFFDQKNIKIQQQMTHYFVDKIQRIKNVKDMQLSKNIFKIINNQPAKSAISKNSLIPPENKQRGQNNSMQKLGQKSIQQKNGIDFHQLLNDQKQLQKFLKNKQQNDPYSRKNISNYSIVRWKKQVLKVKQRKLKQIQDKQSLGTYNAESNEKEFKLSDSVKSQKCRPASVQPKCSNRDNSISTLNQKNHPMLSRLSGKFYSSNNLVSVQGLDQQTIIKQKKLKKKLINQKYNQFNKGKFKLNGFKADRFN